MRLYDVDQGQLARALQSIEYGRYGLRRGVERGKLTGEQADAALGQVSQMLGLDVRKDLLGALGDQWVLYADPAIGGYGFAGTVLVNRMADAAKAEQSAEKMR